MSPFFRKGKKEEDIPSHRPRMDAIVSKKTSQTSRDLRTIDLSHFTKKEEAREEEPVTAPEEEVSEASDIIIMDPQKVNDAAISPVVSNTASPRVRSFIERYWQKGSVPVIPAQTPKENLVQDPMSTKLVDMKPIFSEKNEFSKGVFPRKRKWMWSMGMAGGSLLVVMILLSVVFREVTVAVKPRTEQIPFSDIALTFQSTGVSLGKLVVPAERMEFTKSVVEEFDATGKEFVEERARGKARVYNGFNSSSQSLVATTRFLTESGTLFRLSKGVTIPGAKVEGGKIVPQFVEVELVADRTGEESNINGEVMMKIPGFKGTPKYEGFYAVAPDGFSGGFRGESRVVSAADLKTAEELITKKIYDELKTEIVKKIPPDFKLVDALRQTALTKIDAPRLKSKAERFPVTAEGVNRVIVFRESDVLAAIAGNLLGKGGETREFMGETAVIEYQVKSVDFEKGNALVFLRGHASVKTRIVPEDIAAVAKGKKEGSLIEVLKNRPELASFRVTFFPFWLSRAPADARKIRVVVEEP